MKWYQKLLGIGTLALASLAFSPKKAEACSSAKPAGRGFTNIALAEDASAAYYNPAGLIQLKRPELDITKATSGYKFFLCYGQPLDIKTALGLNFSHRHNGNFSGYESNTYWLKISCSRKSTEKLSTGANLTLKRDYLGDKVLGKEDKPDSVFVGNTQLNMDLGVLYKHDDRIRLGLKLGNCTNVRPGVSFKFDNNLLLIEGYDMLGRSKRPDDRPMRHYRLGLERKISDRLSLRAGFERNLDNEFEHITSGVSFGKKDLEMSVAVLYWRDRYESLALSLNKRF